MPYEKDPYCGAISPGATLRGTLLAAVVVAVVIWVAGWSALWRVRLMR